MVHGGAPIGHQFLALPDREREIGLTTPMQVTDFMSLDAELDPSETMRKLFNTRPALHCLLDCLSNGAHSDAPLCTQNPMQSFTWVWVLW
jgi:hypothetical protein